MLLEEVKPLDEGIAKTVGNMAVAGSLAAAGVGSAYLQDKLPSNYEEPTPKVQQAQVQKKELPPLVKKNPQKKKHTNTAKKLVTGNANESILRKTAEAAGIKGEELAAFMAQMAHESMNFSDMTENKPNIKKYGSGKTAKILGNKNETDAKRFIGRGFIQLTGRWNYEWMEKELGMDLTSTWSAAHQAADPKVAAKIAVVYWKKRVQPNVENFDDVEQVTKPINASLNGIKDRINKYEQFKVAMNLDGEQSRYY